MLKTEIESAINGKQWLLSCFGPFKESTVIPNLLDRSFEEVRLDFMEASKNGTTQQHVNELIAQYNDSMAKLNQLKMASPDTIQLVANIYNQSVQEQKATPDVAPSISNVFALSNSTVTSPQQNPFPFSNIASGGQRNMMALMDAGHIFGGSTNPVSNPFQSSPQSSIFGAPKDQPASVASSFTFSLDQQAPQQSVFGSTQHQSPQSSIFGSAQPVQLQQQQQTPASIFGGQTSTFGGAAMFPASPLQQQPQPQPQSSIFGSSLFAQSQPVAPAAGQGIFGSPLQTSTQPFQQQQQQQQPIAGNVFGGFHSQALPSDTQNQHPGNIFAQANSAPPQQSQNVFGIQQTASVQQLPTSAPGSIFQIQQPIANSQQTPFGSNPFQTQPTQIDESVYSRPEDLTPDEMQAFQSDGLRLGSIPLKPPPRHLCI